MACTGSVTKGAASLVTRLDARGLDQSRYAVLTARETSIDEVTNNTRRTIRATARS